MMNVATNYVLIVFGNGNIGRSLLKIINEFYSGFYSILYGL